MAQHTENHGEKVPAQTREIWVTFWILLIITSIEFVIAFTIDADHYKWTKIGIFVILTLVKAYFIVATFMHLKYEVKSLIWTIILPCMFVVWLVGALMMEGDYIGIERILFK